MLQGAVSRTMLCLSCCLLLGVFSHQAESTEGSGEADSEDWEWGSGSSFLHLLHSFPADSPFTTETEDMPLNCSQRFWLPPPTSVCWDNIVGPEQFARSRLLVLQNRAALQAVSISSGVEEGGISYDHQAKDEVRGIHSDHQDTVETMLTMENALASLEEKRKDGKEQGVLTSMKEHLSDTRAAIDGREHMADLIEKQFSILETSLLNMQLRINQLIQ